MRALKIGIVTIHRSYNFGAVLQAYALKTSLKVLGYNADVLDDARYDLKWRFQGFLSLKGHGIKFCIRFVRQLIREFCAIGFEDLRLYRNRQIHNRILAIKKGRGIESCDCLVYGSDQIWNPRLFPGKNAYFLGENVNEGIRKISYAASLGDVVLNEGELSRLKIAAQRFGAIGVREQTVNLQDSQGRQAVWVVDPTLLLAAKDYNLIAWPRRLVKEKYILAYYLFANKKYIEFANEISKKLKLKVVFLSVYHYGWFGKPLKIRTLETPDRFLAYFRDAECVITQSFHGLAFSLIFKKPFVSIRNIGGSPHSRQASLLRRIGSEDRLVNISEDTTSKVLSLLSVCVDDANYCRLEAFRKASLDWLKNSLREVLI